MNTTIWATSEQNLKSFALAVPEIFYGD